MPTAVTTYREIPGFPGYRAGSDGSVWTSYERGRWGRILDHWKALKLWSDKDGYRHTNLKSAAGPKVHVKVHRIILEAFVGPMPVGQMVRHLDGDPGNNSIDNLAYGTAAENGRDTSRHGRSNRGSRCPTAKLDDEAVRRIRRQVASGRSQRAVARDMGISNSTVCMAVNGRSWSHVEESA